MDSSCKACGSALPKKAAEIASCGICKASLHRVCPKISSAQKTLTPSGKTMFYCTVRCCTIASTSPSLPVKSEEVKKSRPRKRKPEEDKASDQPKSRKTMKANLPVAAPLAGQSAVSARLKSTAEKIARAQATAAGILGEGLLLGRRGAAGGADEEPKTVMMDTDSKGFGSPAAPASSSASASALAAEALSSLARSGPHSQSHPLSALSDFEQIFTKCSSLCNVKPDVLRAVLRFIADHCLVWSPDCSQPFNAEAYHQPNTDQMLSLFDHVGKGALPDSCKQKHKPIALQTFTAVVRARWKALGLMLVS